MAAITKTGLREELDAGIHDARKRRKRSRSDIGVAIQRGREEAYQSIREIFLDGFLPEDEDQT